MRAKRLDLPQENLKILSETNVEKICEAAQEHKPEIFVVDSIQVMHSTDVPSAPGSVSQVEKTLLFLSNMRNKQTPF